MLGIDIKNGPNPITFTHHALGDDASIVSLDAAHGDNRPYMIYLELHFSIDL